MVLALSKKTERITTRIPVDIRDKLIEPLGSRHDRKEVD